MNSQSAEKHISSVLSFPPCYRFPPPPQKHQGSDMWSLREIQTYFPGVEVEVPERHQYGELVCVCFSSTPTAKRETYLELPLSSASNSVLKAGRGSLELAHVTSA